MFLLNHITRRATATFNLGILGRVAVGHQGAEKARWARIITIGAYLGGHDSRQVVIVEECNS